MPGLTFLRAGVAGSALAILALLQLAGTQDALPSPPDLSSAAAQAQCFVEKGEFQGVPIPCTPTPIRRIQRVPVEATDTPTPPQIEFPPSLFGLPPPSPTTTPTAPPPTVPETATPTRTPTPTKPPTPPTPAIAASQCVPLVEDASAWGSAWPTILVLWWPTGEFGTLQESLGYLRFDLSGIPHGATISFAELRLYLDSGSGQGEDDPTVNLWRLRSPWSGSYSPVSPPQVFYPEISSAVSPTPGLKTWTVTDLVKGWVNGGWPNYGLVLAGVWFRPTGDWGPVEIFESKFRSSEYGDPSSAPCLWVEYQVKPGPTPTAGPTWTPAPTWTPYPTMAETFSELPTPTAAPLMLEVADMELMQTVANSSLGLVDYKATLVRVIIEGSHLGATGSFTHNFDVYLSGLGGSPLPPCFPHADYGPFQAPPSGLERQDGNITVTAGGPPRFKEVRFVIDRNCAWLHGDIGLRASVHWRSGGIWEANMRERIFRLHPLRPARVQFFSFVYENPGDPLNGATPDLADLLRVAWFMERIYPSHKVVVYQGGLWGADVTDYSDADDFKSDLLWEFGGCFVLCAGSASGNVDTGLFLLSSSLPDVGGMAWTPGRHGVCSVARTAVCAHEAMHSFGLGHSSCAHGEADGGGCDDLSPHGVIDRAGWDYGAMTGIHRNLIAREGVSPAWHSHDIMAYEKPTCADAGGPGPTSDGYCHDNWIHSTNYFQMAQLLHCDDPQTGWWGGWNWCINVESNWPGLEGRGELTAAGFGGVASTGGGAQGAGERLYLRVDGRIYLDGPAEFLPFYQRTLLPGLHDEGLTGGTYDLELQAADGSVLFRRSFEPSGVMHDSRRPVRVSEVVPWPGSDESGGPEKRRQRAGRAHGLAQRARGQGTGAQRRRALGRRRSGNGSLGRPGPRRRRAGLLGRVQRRWRPDVGERAAQRSGNEPVGEPGQSGRQRAGPHPGARDRRCQHQLRHVGRSFHRARKAPEVGIGEPSEGAEVRRGEEVRFGGVAFDREDSFLPGDALVWESDVDGVLGTGQTLEIRRLSPGPHLITLRATDSDGQQGTASIRVLVEEPASDGAGAGSDVHAGVGAGELVAVAVPLGVAAWVALGVRRRLPIRSVGDP